MIGRLLGGANNLLLRQLAGTEWRQLRDYVSPSFFEVLPPRALAGQVRELVKNASDSRGFSQLREEIEERLAARDIVVRLAEGDGPAPGRAADTEAERQVLGQRVLEIYFGQLFAADAAILDLRAGRFELEGSVPRWRPRPVYVRWEPGFLEAIRSLYQGFYDGDDARYDGALEALGITPAREVFRQHFGDGDQACVRFEARVFHETFHEAFVRCRDAGVSLHRNFLTLGIYLACLYDQLEALDLAFDVRGAFARSAR